MILFCLFLASFPLSNKDPLPSPQKLKEAMTHYETTVESNQAHYNGDTITLTGNVVVENAMGKVFAQKAVLKKDDKKKAAIDFPLIELTKEVTLIFSNGSQLTCESLFLNFLEKTSFFVGAPQVIYSDDTYDVFADEAKIDYREINGSIEPLKIVLSKNVRLVNRGSHKRPEQQYALADHVTYFFETQLMVLEGNDKPVLFYDKLRGMELSAKKVHASRDLQTKKEVIQGMGDVRFVFGNEEFERLKKRFHWDK